MTSNRLLINTHLSNDQLALAKKLLFDSCGFSISNISIDQESKEYGACTFRMNGMNILFRTSKITPKKNGQFVTVWKRNLSGQTQPFDQADEFDLLIISSMDREKFGLFIFPKSILLEKGIITGYKKQGKRGIRVYPPWSNPSNKQAIRTQAWQTTYFLSIDTNGSTDLIYAKKLLSASTGS